MAWETGIRFAEIGLKVELIRDPETGYLTFDIVQRLHKHDFDIEEKIWEVREAKKKNEHVEEL